MALEASEVREIVLMPQLSTPSGLPSMIAGFLNLAQKPVPVIRIARLLNLPETNYGLYTQIMIVRGGTDGFSAGWIVDRVTQIVSIAEEEVLQVPKDHCFRDCAQGIFTVSGTPVTILAPDRVLLAKERQCLQEFQAMELKRADELKSLEP